MGEGEGCTRAWVRLPSQPPHIYRGKGEGAQPPQIESEEGAAAWGVALPPKARGRPPLGFPPSPMHLGPWWGAHQPTWGWSPPTLGPCSPLGPVAPLGGPPGPSRWSRYITDSTRNFSGDQNRTSHINLYLRTIPELLVTSGISSGTPNNIQ